MDATHQILLGVAVLGTMFAFLCAGLWIGITLLLCGFVAIEFFNFGVTFWVFDLYSPRETPNRS